MSCSCDESSSRPAFISKWIQVCRSQSEWTVLFSFIEPKEFSDFLLLWFWTVCQDWHFWLRKLASWLISMKLSELVNLAVWVQGFLHLCPSLLFLWMQHLCNTLRKLLQLWFDCRVVLRDSTVLKWLCFSNCHFFSRKHYRICCIENSLWDHKSVDNSLTLHLTSTLTFSETTDAK